MFGAAWILIYLSPHRDLDMDKRFDAMLKILASPYSDLIFQQPDQRLRRSSGSSKIGQFAYGRHTCYQTPCPRQAIATFADALQQHYSTPGEN